ncbi:MAG TPA: DUF6600 domain-containing protein [Steroidobacteraceae bacterium]
MSASLALTAFAISASADENDPSTRIARLSYVEGSVSFQPGGSDQWVDPPLNRPLTTGDQLWSDKNGRAELELDGSLLRLSASTAVSLLNISDNATQIQLSSGSLLLSVRRLDDGEAYEVDTPNLAFTVLQPGLYRISVDPTGNSTALLIRSGQGEVTGGGIAYPVAAGEYDLFSGNDELTENAMNYSTDQDDFERWGAARDARWDHSESARYVSTDVVGYEDLDEQGTWANEPEYGNVWFPRAVEPGWAPYHSGHWAYVAPWGYTWVDDHAWGFAPFHYGRWASVRGRWCWIPVPPRRRGVDYIRPVYAPALVAWVGVGAGVAWFALGPHEVYVPSYRVSRGYVRNVNVSNTYVNTTVINNVYNTTIINKRVDSNIPYANRRVPGAVAATTSQAFTSAQPVGRNRVRFDQSSVANARVAPTAPATMPTKRALLGSGRMTNIRPPAEVQARPVVARVAPPARRQRNATLPAQNAPLPPNVRIAPTPRRVAPARNAASTPPVANPPAAAATPVPNLRHPQETPAPHQPPSPTVTNPAVERHGVQDQQLAQQNAERQRLQQAQAQQAQQNAERQRLQQAQAQQQAQQRAQELQQQAQQNAERQRLQQAQAQQAQQRAQELQQQAQQNAERQRLQQAQAQQQAQQRAQELQQSQARQQEQHRQQETAAAAAAKTRRPDSPPPKPDKDRQPH